MPRRKAGTPPSYRFHKPSGQAVVTIDGKDYYLGEHGTPASRQKYAGLIRSWAERQTNPPPEPAPLTPDDRPTVNDLVLGFLRARRDYYKPDAKGISGELVCISIALEVVQQVCGREPADQFGPKKLKEVRQAMIDRDWARSYVDHQVSRVKRMFAWAVEEELIPGTVYHSLLAVKGLKKGAVRESKKVGPAPTAAVKAVLAKAHPVLAAMIRFQWHTGCRPGELCALRPRHLDRTNHVWVYTVPAEANKTDHLGQARKVYIGPKAQRVLEPWLAIGDDEFVFSPKRAEEIRSQARRKARTTALYPSHVARLARARKQAPGRPKRDAYCPKSYRRAVVRACELAGAEPWHPNQLRHAAATRFRRKHGVETARVLLGHRKLSTTEVYAEKNERKAVRAAKKLG